MDTIPFHFLMIALDIVLCGFLIFWLIFNFRFVGIGGRDSGVDIYYEVPLSGSDRGDSELLSKGDSLADNFWFRKFIWRLFGVVLGGVICLFGIVFFAVIFRRNFGQCFVEGLTFHVGFYLLFSSVLLFILRSYIVGVILFLFGVIVVVLGVDMLYIEPNNLVYEYYRLESPKARSAFRVVFVADIQTDNIGEYERRTLRMIMDAKPDLIILGGDYLQYYAGTVGVSMLPERFRQLFKEIPLEAELGVYAVAGNVDYSSGEQFSELFKDTTVEPIFSSEMINNLGEEEGKGPIDIKFLSVVDSINGGLGETLLSKSGNFTIVVGHYPNYAIKDYQFSDRAPDLMLAGHTHGGQIYIPFFGALRVKYTHREAVITQEFLRGMKRFKNGGNLLITRGSGMERGWAPRVRFLCKPEISVIDVEPTKKK
ncbi:MAG: metallophosphoesterase [Planctomycetaceae bacterium]|jgi:predicted MPP superfamily phosphohydrolase|nr:metallophosphoesterase [Planctomycetaceae bacterium]